jgi:hypothetical protein
MKIQKNGILITNVKIAEQSNIGDDYICMWDDDGMPIHINKAVVDYLHSMTHLPKQPTTAKLDDTLVTDIGN